MSFSRLYQNHNNHNNNNDTQLWRMRYMQNECLPERSRLIVCDAIEYGQMALRKLLSLMIEVGKKWGEESRTAADILPHTQP